MKYLHLFALLLLMPTTGLFAQIEKPNFIDPDDELYLDTDSLPLTDSTTTVFNDKIDIDNSTVLQMLDMVGGISYFQDSYLDIDTNQLNVYDYNKYEVPSFSDEVYAERIRTLARATTMPLVFNQKVKAYINLYADRKRMQSSRMLGLSYVYFPMFEEKLAKYDLPLELKYLAMVESALNPTAGSHAGAKGLWQFMTATAKDYGLKVTTLIDERYDPERETEAACRFLKNLYSRYGDWFLVLAAYNSGPGTVNKAIVR
jgi:membrane-bound lytic murein transglycosylase D